MDASFAGRYFDESLLRDLPEAWTRAAKTASSIALYSRDRSSPARSGSRSVKSLGGTGFVFCDVLTKTEE